MSFNFGQFRSSQISSYSTPKTMELTIGQSSNITENISFYNRYGNLLGDNQVNNLNCYYLKFTVKKRSDSEQRFYLKLQNSNLTEDNQQLIEEFKVAAKSSGSDTETFEIIIAPNATYNRFVWELQRTILDYRMVNADGTYGRIMDITVDAYTQLIDIISQKLKSDYSNMEHLTKIGIQGPPSLLMCINREQIRIGRNGIYEINNGININSISFVPKNSTDYFIMDFEY